MRELLFKNLTSQDKRRRVIASSEVSDNQGIHTVVRRHFVYLVREIKGKGTQRPKPYLYVLREHNNTSQTEKFFCRLKASVYAVYQGKLYLILFMHSLKIILVAANQESLTGYDKNTS